MKPKLTEQEDSLHDKVPLLTDLQSLGEKGGMTQINSENSLIQGINLKKKKKCNFKIIPFLTDSVCCPAGKAGGLVGQTQRKGRSASHGTSGLCDDLV